MGRDSTVAIERALVWFARGYLADLKELDRRVAAPPRHSHLRPVGDLQEEFDIADQSVIGDHDVEKAYRPTRRLWQDDPQLALLGSLENEFLVESGHLHVTVLRPKSGVGVLIMAAAFDLRNLTSSDGLLALTASASPTNLAESIRAGPSGFDLSLDGFGHESLHAMLGYAATQFLGSDRSSVVGPLRPLEYRIIELRGVHCLDGDEEDEALRLRAAPELYGILTGDEGWPFVPQERAERAATEGWTSRSFLWITAQRSSVLVINDKSSACDYRDRAQRFFGRWLGVDTPYFREDFSVAGLDHGALYAVEKIIAMGVQADAVSDEVQKRIRNPTRHRIRAAHRWVRRRVLHRPVDELPLLEIRLPIHDLLVGRLRSTRLRLLACIESVQQTHVAELGRLYDRLCEQTGLIGQTDQLKDYVEMIDNELHEGIKVMLSYGALLVAFTAFMISLLHL